MCSLVCWRGRWASLKSVGDNEKGAQPTSTATTSAQAPRLVRTLRETSQGITCRWWSSVCRKLQRASGYLAVGPHWRKSVRCSVLRRGLSSRRVPAFCSDIGTNKCRGIFASFLIVYRHEHRAKDFVHLPQARRASAPLRMWNGVAWSVIWTAASVQGCIIFCHLVALSL